MDEAKRLLPRLETQLPRTRLVEAHERAVRPGALRQLGQLALLVPPRIRRAYGNEPARQARDGNAVSIGHVNVHGREVANQQRVRFTNQVGETQRFTIEVLDPPGARLVVSESPVVVRPEQVVTVNLVTTTTRDVFANGQAPVRYLVRSDRGFQKDVTFLLLGPFGQAGERK